VRDHNGQQLLLSAVVIGTAGLGAVVLWVATGWLWLVLHQGLHWREHFSVSLRRQAHADKAQPWSGLTQHTHRG